jgi:hypothetical protein
MMIKPIFSFLLGTILLTACSSQSGDHSDSTSVPTSSSSTSEVKPKVEPVVVHGVDLTFPYDTTWFALTADRCTFLTYVPERGGDYRARVLDMEGNLVKTIYETGLKAGIHELSFNPQPLEPGSYVYMLTKDIYADTLQVCRFDVQISPEVDLGE